MTAPASWDTVLDETVAHLSRMIQFDTTNPPGNELPLARYIASVLHDAGIETRILEPTANRGAVVARIRGSGRARPVLLLAHMDVVAADATGWSVPPFGGELRDGYVYGRGAIDDKGMLAANLMVMLLLQRSIARTGLALRRDVVFVATPDEEGPGEWGIDWLAMHHRELLDAEFAINDGGRIRIVDGRPLYAAVQTAEKVSHLVTVTAHGTGGHAAVPLPDNAVVLLARAIARIAAHREPFRLLPTTRAFFAELSRVWPHRAESRAMRDVVSDDPARAARGAMRLSRIPAFGAVLRTGISPTIIAGGSVHNVIPDTASATLAIRTLPGDSIHDVVERLRQLVNDGRVEIAITHEGTDTPTSDFRSPMFAAVRDSISALDPSIVTVPYLSTGATDSAVLRALGVQAFGLLPFPLAQADESRMHGVDERVPVAALLFGVRLLFDTMLRIAADTTAAHVMH
jgi:acetylornithine deacetylase/succinyl-diaminopimelate desuccinylase-like protein